jgi:hypothetical protein
MTNLDDPYVIHEELAFTLLSVCQFLHISRRTAQRWIKSGKLKTHKLHVHIVKLSEINRQRKLRGLAQLTDETALELFEALNQ